MDNTSSHTIIEHRLFASTLLGTRKLCYYTRNFLSLLSKTGNKTHYNARARHCCFVAVPFKEVEQFVSNCIKKGSVSEFLCIKCVI